jgi:hypothetical protein
MKYGIKVGAILIGTYLLLARATGAGSLMSKAGSAGVGVIKAFQGR